MKRVFDILLGCLATLILFVPVLLVAVAVCVTSKGPALYWSDRLGRNNVIFKMPKFRSMRLGTPAVATHLLAFLYMFVYVFAFLIIISPVLPIREK